VGQGFGTVERVSIDQGHLVFIDLRLKEFSCIALFNDVSLTLKKFLPVFETHQPWGSVLRSFEKKVSGD